MWRLQARHAWGFAGFVLSFLELLNADFTSSSAGAVECPCVTEAWAGFAALTAEITARGFPASYGLQGCRRYDEGTPNCTGTAPPPYCSAQFCYVDPATCTENRVQCEDEGHVFNDAVHTACRSRNFVRSKLWATEVWYSYATCGYLDRYDASPFRALVEGKKILSTTTHDLPYHGVSYGATGEASFFGVEVDFFQKALEELDTNVDFAMSDAWASNATRARFSSSFTAAVNDVAVGSFDVAVGDFWVTAERVLMTPFLPAIRSDLFYLVTFVSQGRTSFATVLSNPFKPFSNEAWALVVGVAGLVAVSMAFLSVHDSDEFSLEGLMPSDAHSWHKVLPLSLFLAFASLVKGESKYTTSSLPTKLCYISFQFFLLVVLASYTANLASMLTVTKVQTGVGGIKEAIEQKQTICIPAAIEGTIRLLYPAASLYVYGGDTGDFARHLHAGQCGSAVIHEKKVQLLHAGSIQEQDCKRLEKMELSAEEALCSADRYGAPRDDCAIQAVGTAILSIPIAFPVYSGSRLLEPLSWAITRAQNAGRWESAVQANEHLYPQPLCTEALLNTGQLRWEDFAGVSFIVAAVSILALVLHFLPRLFTPGGVCGRFVNTRQAAGQTAPEPEPEPEPEPMPVPALRSQDSWMKVKKVATALALVNNWTPAQAARAAAVQTRAPVGRAGSSSANERIQRLAEELGEIMNSEIAKAVAQAADRGPQADRRRGSAASHGHGGHVAYEPGKAFQSAGPVLVSNLNPLAAARRDSAAVPVSHGSGQPPSVHVEGVPVHTNSNGHGADDVFPLQSFKVPASSWAWALGDSAWSCSHGHGHGDTQWPELSPSQSESG